MVGIGVFANCAQALAEDSSQIQSGSQTLTASFVSDAHSRSPVDLSQDSVTLFIGAASRIQRLWRVFQLRKELKLTALRRRLRTILSRTATGVQKIFRGIPAIISER